MPMPEQNLDSIPSSLRNSRAASFWFAVLATGAGAGLSAALLTRILEFVQRGMWGGSGTDLLASAQSTPALRHILILAGAGVVTCVGQIILKKLSSGKTAGKT